MRSIGGLIGFIASGYAPVTITDGYYSGTLTGGATGYWAGLAAVPSSGSNTYNNSYFAYYAAGAGQNHAVPASSTAGTYGKSWLLNGSSYYADSANDVDFSGWDFTNIWNPATSSTPPTLR